MKLIWNPWKVLAAAGIAVVLAACDLGTLEKAGKAIDNKVNDIKR